MCKSRSQKTRYTSSKIEERDIHQVVTKAGTTIRRSTLGGKKKLTDEVINALGRYYGKAICDNVHGNLEVMKRACRSGFRHVASTDDRPDHELCPDGQDSHCFYKKAIARGEIPQSHSTMKVRCELNEEQRKLVQRVIDDLTSDDLLLKCLSGRTQNPNESFHSKVWSKLHKTKHYGLNTIKYMTAQAVVEHNSGYENSNVLEHMGFPNRTDHAAKLNTSRDAERKRQASKPKPRKSRYLQRDPPGGVWYGAGEF